MEIIPISISHRPAEFDLRKLYLDCQTSPFLRTLLSCQPHPLPARTIPSVRKNIPFLHEQIDPRKKEAIPLTLGIAIPLPVYSKESVIKTSSGSSFASSKKTRGVGAESQFVCNKNCGACNKNQVVCIKKNQRLPGGTGVQKVQLRHLAAGRRPAVFWLGIKGNDCKTNENK